MMQRQFLQSLEETAVLHFDSMIGAFGGHANHGDASRYALRAVHVQNLAHVQMSCASPIRYVQDVTGGAGTAYIGHTLLVALAAHHLCADLCLHNTVCVHVHANVCVRFICAS